MNQLWQQPATRDYFGNWSPNPIANLDPINNPECFRATWFSAPKYNERVVPQAGYRQSQLALPPGGYLHSIGVSDLFAGNDFQVLITDLTLQRQLWNAPIESAVLRHDPFILPDIYPIVAPGLFRVEIWNPSTDSGDILAEVVLICVEPKAYAK